MPSPSFSTLIAERLSGIGAELAEACEKLSADREARLRDENTDLQAQVDALRSRLESVQDVGSAPSLKSSPLKASSQGVLVRTSKVQPQRKCTCGAFFMPDAEFCRRCGRRRASEEIEDIDKECPFVKEEFEFLPELCAKSEDWADKFPDLALEEIDTGYAERKEPTRPVASDSFMLDPASTVRLFWDIMGIPVLSWDLVTIPLGVFDIGQTLHDILSVADWFTLLYWSIDIPFTFFTGFYDKEGSVIMSFRRTAMHYFRGPLLLDIFIIFSDWLSQAIELVSSDEAPSYLSNIAILRVLRVSRFARLVRLRKLKSKLQTIEDSVNNEWYLILVNLVIKVFFVLVINHYICCGWFWLGNSSWAADPEHRWLTNYPWSQFGAVDRLKISDAPWFYQYLTSLHWAIAQFTPGPMNIQGMNEYERLYTIFVLLFGMVIFSSFIAALTQARLTMTKMMGRFERDFWVLRKFCRQNKISPRLQVRMKRYIDFVVVPAQAKLTMAEVSLVKTLSRDLRDQLSTEIFSQILCKHPLLEIFSGHHQSVMHQVCTSAVEPLPLAKGDVAYAGGSVGQFMLFVTNGFLDYIPMMPQQDEQHVKRGDWASEAVLWTRWMHQGQMQASIESKTLTVIGEKFRKVLISNGLIMPFIRRYGIAFVQNLNDLYRQTGMPSDLHGSFACDFFKDSQHAKSKNSLAFLGFQQTKSDVSIEDAPNVSNR